MRDPIQDEKRRRAIVAWWEMLAFDEFKRKVIEAPKLGESQP